MWITHLFLLPKFHWHNLKLSFKEPEGNLAREIITSAHSVKQITWHSSTSASLKMNNPNILFTPLQGTQLPQLKSPIPWGTLRADLPHSDLGKCHHSLRTGKNNNGMECLLAQWGVAGCNKHWNGTREDQRGETIFINLQPRYSHWKWNSRRSYHKITSVTLSKSHVCPLKMNGRLKQSL